MKFKKILTVLPIAFLLSGCKPPADIIIDTTEEKVEDGATKVKMWMMDFEEWENNINISQRKAFNANTSDGIQLEQQYINSLQFDDLIRGAYEAHNVPDIYCVSYGNLYKEIQTGRAIDLTRYFSDTVWSDLTDTATEGVRYNGKYYGFPICMEPSTVLAYRKDLIQKYYGDGFVVPTKWNELTDICKTMRANIKKTNKKGVYTLGLPTGVALAWGSWGMQYAATGGLAVDDNRAESRITNPGYKQLCELFADLYGNGLVPNSAGNYTEASFDLCSGKTIMTVCGSWSVASILNTNPELKDQIGFVEMPTFDGEHTLPTATNGGWAYVISSECKNVEKAVEVLKFLTAENTEQTVDFFQRAHYSKATPRKSVQTILDESYKNQNEVPSEWVEVIRKVAAKAVLEPIYDWDISVAVEGMLEEASMGEDIDKAIAKADSQVKKIISERKTAGTNPRKK